MAALAVGRSTIREAIRHFQALGVIEARKGSGTYLLKPISAATIHMPLSFDPAQLRDALLQSLEVRRGIEAEASMVAARKRTAEDLVIIERNLDEMERVHIAEGTSGPEDLAFHLAIYDATHNPLFRQLLEQMREAFCTSGIIRSSGSTSRGGPFRSTARSSTPLWLRTLKPLGRKHSKSSTLSRKTSRKCPND